MGPIRGQYMSLLSPNLEMCIHFLYSVTIYNDSAFYFTEVIVLISWEGTPTQIRMRVGIITFHACGGEGGHGGSVCLLYVKILKYLYICSDSASYFLEMSILIILVGTLTQVRMGLGCITFPGIGPRRGQYAFLMSKSRMLMHFQPLIIVLGFSASYYLEFAGRMWDLIVSVPDHCLSFYFVMPIRKVGTLTQTRMRIGSLTFPDMGFMRG